MAEQPEQTSSKLSSSSFPSQGLPSSSLTIESLAIRLANEISLSSTARSRESEFRRQLIQGAADIAAAYRLAVALLRRGEAISPQAEWIVDNYYVIEEQISEVEDLLPIGFFRKLPKTVSGYSRVGEISRQLLAHCESELDEPTIYRFIESLQSISPLTIGESWAFPILLRVSLIENLRSIALQLINATEQQRDAERRLAIWKSRRIFDLGDSTSHQLAPTIVRMLDLLGGTGEASEANRNENSNAHDSAPKSAISADSNSNVEDPAYAILALRQHVRSLGWDLSELVRLERRRQAASQVLVGNIITSMRLVSAMDWMLFFERTNHADAVLKNDPQNVYGEMDFPSRNEYRKVVENVARQGRKSEIHVAEAAIEMAKAYSVETKPELQARSHVGYWLVGDGLADLMDSLALHASPSQRLLELMRRNPHAVYFGGLAFFTVFMLFAIGWLTSLYTAPWPVALLLIVFAVLPASDVAMLFLSMIVTRLFLPKKLPKLEFRNGIPNEFPTIVVVPSMLSSRKEVRALLEKLEVHYLNNPDPSLSFALLTDFSDAPQPTMPDDNEKLEEAISGIRRLNNKYGSSRTFQDGGTSAGIGSSSQGQFFLFHRARKWNPSEGAWMGWERKRGKLMEFGKLLRGDRSTSYVVQEGNAERIAQFSDSDRHPFVITLDADTQLPRGSAKKMIGTLAHPLNRPHLGRGNIVRTGYSILQPRVTIHLADITKTRYVRVMASSAGLDPYVTATSDVYQDLFGEGSFTGKGIYDLHAFERAVDDAFPENTILSHDLIEGCHARVAVVSDIEVFDGYPLRYDADAKRMHRWVRGDWQISPWLFPRVPYSSGTKRNPLSFLSKWKIFDNLRRSLVAPSTLVLLLLSWFLASAHAAEWSVVALMFAMFPALLSITTGTFDWIQGYRQQRKPFAIFVHMAKQWWFTIEQSLYSAMLLPHKAVQMTDAIVRSNYRMFVSNRKLLEWETAQAAESRLSKNRWAIYQQLWYLPAMGLAVVMLMPSESRLFALPWIAAWILAPWITDQISRVKTTKDKMLSEAQKGDLRGVLAATWAFLEQFVDASNRWLPPDNVQEYPSEKVANRISPTNEGLFLVSTLIARDFGLIGLEKMVSLLEKNTESWKGLYTYRGHWLNWYDTTTGSTLPPRYVSTVDSGNLAICLMTFRTGLDDYLDRPLWGKYLSTGIIDSIAWLLKQVDKLERQITSDSDPLSTTLKSIRHSLSTITQNLPVVPDEPISWLNQQEVLGRCVEELRVLQECAASIDQRNLARKTHIFCDRITGILEDIQRTSGWMIENSIPELVRTAFNRQMSLRALDHLGRLHEPTLQSIAGFSESQSYIRSLMSRMKSLSDWAEESLMRMDFRFLYSADRKIFSIGFNLDTEELDRSFYDLLCSESRLASYFAIAKGDVDSNHWFQLGRKSTIASGNYSLISWGGTMFEYLMPTLFQKSYDLSLLTESARAAVYHQQQYAKSRRVPWGISESGFSTMAKNSDYYYQSFGVPGLGLKRGLSKDLVISPYSTLMSVPFAPFAAYENLQWLRAEQCEGDWGFYEAIDYTTSRLRRNQKAAVVQSYMAHHQGMAILGLANFLDSGSTQRRFSLHPLAKCSELLLQEKLPSSAYVTSVNPDEAEAPPIAVVDEELVSRRILGVDSKAPRINVLSNGLPGNQCSVLTTQAGGGYIRYQDLQVTRWQPDTTLDNAGSFIYLKDIDNGQFWSATFQPTLVSPDAYETTFSVDKTEYRREQGSIETLLEVTVSPEIAAEVRQLRITNHDSVSRTLDITTYSEVLLASLRYSRFDKAFWEKQVETGFDAESVSVFAVRQPFESHPNPLCVLQKMTAPPKVMATVSWETDRSKFIGFGRTAIQPVAIDLEKLDGKAGSTTDPILSLRCRVELPPGESVTIAWTTLLAASSTEAIATAASFQTQRGVQRAFELSWALVPVELKHQSLAAKDVHLFQRLASAILYPDCAYRYSAGSSEVLEPTGASEIDVPIVYMGQADLWPWSISGDWPIVLLEVTSSEQLSLVKEVLQAHRFLLSRGIRHDVILLNGNAGSYYDALHDQIIGLVRDVQSSMDSIRDSVFLLRDSELNAIQSQFLKRVATVFIPSDFDSLSNYLIRSQTNMLGSAGVSASLSNRAEIQKYLDTTGNPAGPLSEKLGNHGHVLTSPPNSKGVLLLGCELHNQGLGSTWQGDSFTYRITSSPKICSTEDTSERIYLSEVVEGGRVVWTVPPVGPQPTNQPYDQLTGTIAAQPNISWQPESSDGPGVSAWSYEFESNQLVQRVSVGFHHEDSVKVIEIKLANRSDRSRRLSLTYAVEFALDVDRIESQMHIATFVDPNSGALIATNTYHRDRPQQCVFLQVLSDERSLTGSRKSFLGRNGNWSSPAALQAEQLDNLVGKGLDPIGAIQTRVMLNPGEEISIVFMLGVAENLANCQRLLGTYVSQAVKKAR